MQHRRVRTKLVANKSQRFGQRTGSISMKLHGLGFVDDSDNLNLRIARDFVEAHDDQARQIG